MSSTKKIRGRKWTRGREYGTSATVAATEVYKIYETNGTSPISSIGAMNGVPEPGDAHPDDGDLVVDTVEYAEGEGPQGVCVVATVNYIRQTSESNLEWGWAAGTEPGELVVDNSATPKKVVNSAGDCFESVPQINRFTPTFTKVVKTEARQSGWMAYNCKVNNAQITIGDMTCAAHTLLASVSEKRLLDDPKYSYQYTIQLKYCSNMVDWQNTGTAEECGWDAVVLDAGMRALYAAPSGSTITNEILQPITKPDAETNTPTKVSTPQLLDGNGHAYSITAEQTPVYLKFQTYPEAAFPGDFYSEPSTT